MVALSIVFSVVVLGVVCLFYWQLNLHFARMYELLDKHAHERQEMLDRIMARDFAQYKQAEILTKQMGSVAAQAVASSPIEENDFEDLSSVGM